MNQAEMNRAENLLRFAAKNALNKIKREHPVLKDWHYSKIQKYIENAFISAVLHQCSKIESAAKVKPAVHKQIEQEKERRKLARKEMADELKAARLKLNKLNWKIENAEKAAELEAVEHRKVWAKKLQSARNKLRCLRQVTEKESLEISEKYIHSISDCNGYPAIPLPAISASTSEDNNIPHISGIYFLWKNDCIEYVGQSKVLCNRLKLGLHHILKPYHQISFIPIKREDLLWAESYYIGICKPKLNFGLFAPHARQERNCNGDK